MWSQLVRVRSGIGLHISHCHIVTGCDGVAKCIEWISGLIARGFLDIRLLKLRTDDFVNMYTDLPQREMVEKLTGLSTYVYARVATLRHVSENFIHAPDFEHVKRKDAVWSSKSTAPKDFVSVSLDTALKWLNFLIRDVHSTAGDVAYHQTEGLSMGENYAVFVANLTYFCYVIIYLKELVKNFNDIKMELPGLRPSSSQTERSDLETTLQALLDRVKTISIRQRYTDDSLEMQHGDGEVEDYIYDARRQGGGNPWALPAPGADLLGRDRGLPTSYRDRLPLRL